MMPSDTAQGTLLADYEDYYERSIQLRCMENQTLRVQLEEKIKTIKETSLKYGRWLRVSIFLGLCISLLFCEAMFPGVLMGYASSVTWSTSSVASHLVAMIVVWIVYQ